MLFGCIKGVFSSGLVCVLPPGLITMFVFLWFIDIILRIILSRLAQSRTGFVTGVSIISEKVSVSEELISEQPELS